MQYLKAHRLRDLRLRAGLTLKQVAERVGMPLASYHRAEHLGEVGPRSRQQIDRAFEILTALAEKNENEEEEKTQ